MRERLYAAIVLALGTTSTNALVISPTSSAADLASSIGGSGVTISNVSYTGALNASGFFSEGIASGIGIESGVILTSGSASGAAGPNNSSSESTNNNLSGNPNLTTLSGNPTFDATILTFDFEFDGGLGGDLFVNYVFASEEYNEFVGSNVNDVFAFFLDGVNVATLPDSSPVSINTVNLGSNSSLFNDNSNGANNIEYDGFTDVLQISALGLSAGTHTMSFAIADAGDPILDSGVFIQASSFSDAPTPTDVPEPSSLILLGIGLIGLGYQRHKQVS